MVRPKGVPSSSLREYRLPMETLESSTREDTLRARRRRERRSTAGLKSGDLERGTMRTFVGATMGGKERTPRASSPSRVQNT
jgi:hypothetical protein